jgi:hypothetical protein
MPAGYKAAPTGHTKRWERLLTLLATPVAYSLFDDASQGIARLLRRRPVVDAETTINEGLQPVAGE